MNRVKEFSEIVHESRKYLYNKTQALKVTYIQRYYILTVTIGLCMFLQHFHLHYGTKLCQGLQMVDMDDEWSENVIQVVTQSLKHFTEIIKV